MINVERLLASLPVVIAPLLAAGCGETPDPTLPDPGAWSAERTRRTKAIADYVAGKDEAYRWFMDFPFGITGGTNYLLLRLLPELAPDQWGEGADFLDVVGMFRDEREPSYPVARGIGWTGMSREDPGAAADSAAFACGACHVGRVRLEDGSIRYLDGGINTHFNFSQFRERVNRSVAALVGDATDPDEQVERASQAILAALERVSTSNKTWFYNDYAMGSRKFDAAYEARQVELFRAGVKSIVTGFLQRSKLEYAAFEVMVKHGYGDIEDALRTGFGGMVDATGVSSSFSFAAAEAAGETPSPETYLPPEPGITDFMAVWEQGKRKVRWNEDQTDLIDGGGQWNGNIPIPIYRNMAAELTLGLGADTDLRIAVFAKELLEDLPAPPYPFDVDMELARKGEALYATHCADCHRPHNGEVYDIGTDMGRAHVVSESIAAGARAGFMALLPPDRPITMPDGRAVKPGAEFEGVPLARTGELTMGDPKDHDGYNALPLGGVWAQAPYLHNGSVPTLYHLLVPGERPTVFVKSRLDYDATWVGFTWKEGEGKPGEGYRFDTSAFTGFSNAGHDEDVVDGAKTYKLDWSDDKDGAMAVIEYMKTL